MRGWGNWSSGVRVYSSLDGGVRVHWQLSRWAKPTADGEEERAGKIAAALEAAGLAYRRDGDVFVVTGEVVK